MTPPDLTEFLVLVLLMTTPISQKYNQINILKTRLFKKNQAGFFLKMLKECFE
jgi:hypothetical protein